MLSSYTIENGRIVEADEKNAQIFFHYGLKTQEDYPPLIRKYGLDAHTLCSAVDPEEIARIDFENDHLAVICKRPHHSQDDQESNMETKFRVASLGMFLFPEKLILIHEEDIPLVDFQESHRQIENLADVVLSLIYHSTLHFYEQFRSIRSQSRTLEKQLINSTSDRQLMELFALEKSMTVYLSSLGSNNILLERMKHNAGVVGFTVKQLDFLEDIEIDSNQCYQQAEISSEIMASLTDTTASLVNNKLGLLMKRLTVISLIFLPINAIAGIGGMSEFTTFAQSLGFSMVAAYGLLGLAMTAIAYLTYLLIRRIGID